MACTQGTSSPPLDTLAHCYIPHCTPGSFPYAYKRKDQGPLTEGWPRGEGRDGARVRPLAPSRVDACNPLLQAHPTWARDKHEGRGISPLTPVSLRLLPPSRSVARRRLWGGARGDYFFVGPGTPPPPGFETPTLLLQRSPASHSEFVVPQALRCGGCSYPREWNRSSVCNGTLSAGVCSLWLSGPEHPSISGAIPCFLLVLSTRTHLSAS
jgi:hypothetical protein